MLISHKETTLLVFLMCVVAFVENAPNVTCVFHARKTLVCDVELPEIANTVDFTCSICPHFRIAKSLINCPDNFPASGCPVNRGRCEYNCQKQHLCNDGHVVMVSYRRDNSNKPASFCRYIATNRLVKPGPVRNLTLTLQRSKVKVAWRKPSDFHNEHVIYRYMVECGSNPNRTIQLKSRKDKVEAFCPSVGIDSSSFEVWVRSQPARHGFWSDPLTAVLPRIAVRRSEGTLSSLIGESESDQKIYVEEATVKSTLLAVLGLLVLLCLLIFITAGWIVWNYALRPSSLSTSDVKAICQHHKLLPDDFHLITVRPTRRCFSSRVTNFRKIEV